MDDRERNQYEYERRNYETRPSKDPKKLRILGVLAALLVLGGLLGWNAAHRHNVAEQRAAMQRQVQQRTSAVREQATTREVRVVQVDKSAIEHLQKGEPIEFYLTEFKRKGYTVTPIHKMQDHSTYVVRGQVQEGNTYRPVQKGALLVTLHTIDKAQPNKVTSVETEDYKQ